MPNVRSLLIHCMNLITTAAGVATKGFLSTYRKVTRILGNPANWVMLCVECAAPVESLYVFYSVDNIHTVKCPNCGKFGDKYIECDWMVIFIDLLLLRDEAIRHVVFNAMAKNQGSLAYRPTEPKTELETGDSVPSLGESYRVMGVYPLTLRMLIFVSLLDVFIQYASSERSTEPSVIHFLVTTSAAWQYLLFSVLCMLDTVLSHILVRYLARKWLKWTDGSAISTSLLIGSFFRLLPILTFIWHYDIPFVEQIIKYASLICTTEILSVTLSTDYGTAGLLTLACRLTSYLLAKGFWYIV